MTLSKLFLVPSPNLLIFCKIMESNASLNRTRMIPYCSVYALYTFRYVTRLSILLKKAKIFYHCVSTKSSTHPSTSTPTQTGGQISSSVIPHSGQQTVQIASATTMANSQSSNTAGSTPTQITATQQQQTPASSHNDYILMCSDENGWLTTREDLKVSQIKSDRELFELFHSRLNRRKSWGRRFANLKTIQRISFVKVGDHLHLYHDTCNP